MVKLVLIASLFCLVCCEDRPTYSVGDCFVIPYENNRKIEKWEEAKLSIYKVLEIGERNYRVKCAIMKNSSNYLEATIRFGLDKYSRKVNCPENF